MLRRVPHDAEIALRSGASRIGGRYCEQIAPAKPLLYLLGQLHVTNEHHGNEHEHPKNSQTLISGTIITSHAVP